MQTPFLGATRITSEYWNDFSAMRSLKEVRVLAACCKRKCNSTVRDIGLSTLTHIDGIEIGFFSGGTNVLGISMAYGLSSFVEVNLLDNGDTSSVESKSSNNVPSSKSTRSDLLSDNISLFQS